MKKTTLLLLVILMSSTFVSAGTGWYSDYVKINVNGAGTSNPPAGWYWIGGDPSYATQLQGTNLGTVSTLAIEGCDMKYWSDTQDRTGGYLYYKIMSADGSTQVVAPVQTAWVQTALGGNNYQGTLASNLNILSGLVYGTTYQLQIWAQSTGSGQGDSYLSNNAANYVATFTVNSTANMAGTYTVGTNPGASFSSLSAAINAINSATILGNITLLISSDITESANFGLAANFGTYTLTIRPDADANRTITFTQATANSGPYGHFVIGVATGNLNSTLTDAMVVAQNNVTINGYAVNGSTRRLTFTTQAAALAGSTLINVIGGCTGTTIQNCILNDQSSTAAKCIYINQFKGTSADVSPANTLISNNIITANDQTITATGGYGVQCSRSGSATTKITGLQILNNLITASGTGIAISYCNGATITGNEIKIEKANSTSGGYGINLVSSIGDINIVANKFSETSTTKSSSTVDTYSIIVSANASNPFNANIYNNLFSGIDRKATGATTINQAYIGDIGYGTTKIYNNTFFLPALTQPTVSGPYCALRFTGSAYKADVQNNIFISNEDAKSVLISNVITAGPVNNNVYYLRAGTTNAKVVSTYSTLAAYQTAYPTLDVNSKSVDVNFTNAATGDFTLTGASIQDVNLAVPLLAAVMTDFSGTNRGATTYAGAFQSTPYIFTAVNPVMSGSNILPTATGVKVSCSKLSDIDVYTVNGMLMGSVKSALSFETDLNAGVYLIKVNGKTTKFLK